MEADILLSFFKTRHGLVPVKSLDELKDAERVIIVGAKSRYVFEDFTIQEFVKIGDRLIVTNGQHATGRYVNTKGGRIEYLNLLPAGPSEQLGHILSVPDTISRAEIMDGRVFVFPIQDGTAAGVYSGHSPSVQ